MRFFISFLLILFSSPALAGVVLWDHSRAMVLEDSVEVWKEGRWQALETKSLWGYQDESQKFRWGINFAAEKPGGLLHQDRQYGFWRGGVFSFDRRGAAKGTTS